MATVINVPRDTRFGNIGRGLGEGFAAFLKKKEEDKRKKDIKAALDELLTKEGEGVLEEAEDIAEEEPSEETLERAKKAAPRVPRKSELGINEILGALGQFMQPQDLAEILIDARSTGAKKAPRTIKVFGADGREKTIEVPFDAAAIANVQQLGAVAPGADLEGFSLTKPVGGGADETDKGRLIAQLVKDGVPRSRAFRLAHKLERIEIVPQLGIARHISSVGIAVREVP